MLAALLALALAWHASLCLAASSSSSGVTSVPLYHNRAALHRRAVPLHKRGAIDVPWVVGAREHLRRKYGAQGRENGRQLDRRQQLGDLELGNAFSDALYYAAIDVGTPATTYNFIADTGSSDMWVASPSCTSSGGCPSSAPTYDPSQSSTSATTNDEFSIAYGSGKASGTMVTDTVSLGGYSKSGVLFAVANSTSSILRDNLALSGIAGFGWSSIATSGATPLWELLAESGTLKQGVFSFALTRASGTLAQSSPAPNQGSSRMARWRRTMMGMPDLASASTIGSEIAATGSTDASSDSSNAEYGGTLTLGGVNESLFQGKINMVKLTNKGFWLVPMEGVSVNGQNTSISEVQNVAIDTGTSLIAAPAAACAAIFGKIGGAQPSTDPNFQGYWEFPCNASQTTVALQFNGVSYPMDPKDFNLGQVSDGMCLGSVFELDLASSNSTTSPSWIVGDAWLKNVYSVYQFNPPAVGFAQLSSSWIASNGGDGVSPSNATNGSETTVASSASVGMDRRWGWAAASALLLLATM